MEKSVIFRVLLPIGFSLVIAVGVMVFSGGSAHHELSEPKTRNGVDVWRRENCVSCHAIYGLGGHIAPDLTNFWRRRGLQYIQHVLRNGTMAMPALALSDREIDALARYLQHVDGLG